MTEEDWLEGRCKKCTHFLDHQNVKHNGNCPDDMSKIENVRRVAREEFEIMMKELK